LSCADYHLAQNAKIDLDHSLPGRGQHVKARCWVVNEPTPRERVGSARETFACGRPRQVCRERSHAAAGPAESMRVPQAREFSETCRAAARTPTVNQRAENVRSVHAPPRAFFEKSTRRSTAGQQCAEMAKITCGRRKSAHVDVGWD
jgi:hypothetical protein